MMKSMSSAVSGLKAQQTAMDVLGNNVANVNTTGFRSSSTQFEDMFYQTLSAGSSETNPSQVGYGSEVEGVSKNMTSGGATTTSAPGDLYINGDGYFAVCTSPGTTTGSGTTAVTTPTTTANYYTRVGSTSWDASGYLVDGNGNYIMGTPSTTASPVAQNPIRLIGSYINGLQIVASGAVAATSTTAATQVNYSDLRDLTFKTDGTISASENSTTGTITSDKAAANNVTIELATFANENGLSSVGGNYYQTSSSSGAASYSAPGIGNTTKIQADALESSNVDIAAEFTNMIVSQRGFQANARVITTSDTLLEELINLKRS